MLKKTMTVEQWICLFNKEISTLKEKESSDCQTYVGTTAPSFLGIEGDIYIRTTPLSFYCFLNGSWVDMGNISIDGGIF